MIPFMKEARWERLRIYLYHSSVEKANVLIKVLLTTLKKYELDEVCAFSDPFGPLFYEGIIYPTAVNIGKDKKNEVVYILEAHEDKLEVDLWGSGVKVHKYAKELKEFLENLKGRLHNMPDDPTKLFYVRDDEYDITTRSGKINLKRPLEEHVQELFEKYVIPLSREVRKKGTPSSLYEIYRKILKGLSIV